MPSRHAIATPSGKHLIFLCRVIAVIGLVVSLGWLMVFVVLHEWDLVLSLLILGIAVVPCWRLAACGYFSAGLMLSQIFCVIFVIVFCLFYDVPEAMVQRTTHLYLLVIALVGYMNFQSNRSTMQIIIIVFSLIAFIIFCNNTVTLSLVNEMPRRFRSFSIWVNPVLATTILCGAIAAMHADLSRMTAKARSIQHALYNDEFVLVFQPLVDRTGGMIGAEALLRWQHPGQGMLPPSEFIPEAQDAGLMPAIGEWVIASAFRELALWQENALTRHLTLSINITVDHLMQHNFIDELIKNAKNAGIPASLVKLELTESVFASDPDTIVARMNDLAHAGFKFSLDDFGTGFSSLSYLRRLPLEQIKIDRSFVSAASESKKGAVIARIIAQMGAELSLEVLAEGIETTEQWSIMQRFGCTVFQGFLFSRPLSAADLQRFICENKAASE